MDVSSLSLEESDFSPYAFEKEESEIECSSHKTQSLWEKLHGKVSCVCSRIVHVTRRSIGSAVRDLFFFPLKCPLIANREFVRKRLQLEEDYCHDFWNPDTPLDLNFPDGPKILEVFFPPQDRTVKIHLNTGKTVEITYRLIETKQQGDSCYNFVQIPGIYGTIHNTVGNIYPFLSAYVNTENAPPAKFLIVSANNLHFKPANLKEVGLALSETLKILQAEHGPFDQIVAQSLGNVFLASALKQTDDPAILPKHLCFDRGPTSIWEVSKKYFFGFGMLLYPLVKFSGWASDVEQNILDFHQKSKNPPSITIVGADEDHHFSGAANLSCGEKIKTIPNIQILVFAPPHQMVNETGQHNMRADFLNSKYLTEPSNFMTPSENLSQAILRRSIPST